MHFLLMYEKRNSMTENNLSHRLEKRYKFQKEKEFKKIN